MAWFLSAFTWFLSSSWPKIIGIVLTTFLITSYGVNITMIYSPSYRLWVWKKITEVEANDNSENGRVRRATLLSDAKRLLER